MADDTKPTIMAEKDGPLYIQNAKGLFSCWVVMATLLRLRTMRLHCVAADSLEISLFAMTAISGRDLNQR